jgi:hypothetical protein
MMAPNKKVVEEAMTYGAHRRCCDADSHIMETVDWIERHADPVEA